MPDGTTAADQRGEQPQDPGTPEEQINSAVVAAEAGEWLRSIFGIDWQAESGGGGQGGQFMFADLAQLDGIISAWGEEVEGIKSDLREIERALSTVERPAGDAMSTLHMATARQSLRALLEHSQQMLEYARGYQEKLERSRAQMSSDEDTVHTSMRNVYRA